MNVDDFHWTIIEICIHTGVCSDFEPYNKLISQNGDNFRGQSDRRQQGTLDLIDETAKTRARRERNWKNSSYLFGESKETYG